MKVLLVEDTGSKAEQVILLLKQTLGHGDVSIQMAKSFISAVRMLQNETFDLLVLDLMLPVRDGEHATQNGGKNVLAEIVSGPPCRRPSHIICLTEFEEITNILREEVENNLVHIVIYKETDSKWRHSLEVKAQYVQQRLKDADISPRDYNVDIAIVTSSPRVELKEVTKLPGLFVGEYHQSDALYYFSANWLAKGQRQLSVVACSAPSLGMTATCVTACKVIERWRPRYLVMTGIAAGTGKGQEYGDIIVADSAFDYGSGKILETENEERLFVPSPNPLTIDADLHAVLQLWEREQKQMDVIQKRWHIHQPRTPQLILGIVASGAAVVQSKNVVDEILSNYRKVVGLEMEAYAIFQAAYLARVPRPKVLVAKSISDFADRHKSDEWQQYAAFTSAQFIYEFFTNATELKLGKSA